MHAMDVFAEEQALRRLKPMKTVKLKGYVAVAILALALGCLVFATAKRPPEEPAWLIPAIFLLIEAAILGCTIYQYYRLKNFIENGKVVLATIEAGMRMPRQIRRINLTYTFDKVEYKRASNIPSQLTKIIVGNESIPLIIDSKNPKSFEMMFQFGQTRKDGYAMMRRERTLSQVQG